MSTSIISTNDKNFFPKLHLHVYTPPHTHTHTLILHVSTHHTPYHPTHPPPNQYLGLRREVDDGDMLIYKFTKTDENAWVLNPS